MQNSHTNRNFVLHFHAQKQGVLQRVCEFCTCWVILDLGLLFQITSIDDNESMYLKVMLDDIFGAENFVQQIVWKNKYGPGAMTRGFGNVHEYIFCYSKTPIDSIEAPLSGEDAGKYKWRDDKFPIRGGFVTQPLATRSKDDRPNLVYSVKYNGEEIWPDKQWIWAKDRMLAAIANVLPKSK